MSRNYTNKDIKHYKQSLFTSYRHTCTQRITSSTNALGGGVVRVFLHHSFLHCTQGRDQLVVQRLSWLYPWKTASSGGHLFTCTVEGRLMLTKIWHSKHYSLTPQCFKTSHFAAFCWGKRQELTCQCL